jgi:N-acetylglutamate synthase-like GNAT family acetyltransferase
VTITIRPAREDDQTTIEALIRAARLNPRSLDWQRFLVAEQDGRVVGIRQVKEHSGGTREVGSGYVLAEARRQGISKALMEAVLARESGTLYTLVDAKWVPYYEQFGFVRVDPASLPADFHREYNIGRTVTTLMTLFAKEKVRIVPMVREASLGKCGRGEPQFIPATGRSAPPQLRAGE